MTFTKRETQRGEWTAWGMRFAIGCIVALGLLWSTGCGQDGQSVTLSDVQVFLKSGNAKGEMSLRANGAPLSYNMTHSLGPNVAIEFDGSIDFSKAASGPGDDE